MEPVIKYQYTYFIKSFSIKQNIYKKYILSLLNNGKLELKKWNKEKDIGIDRYFKNNIKKLMFSSLYNTKNKLEKREILKMPCICFEYKINQNAQAKLGNEDGIFFKIEKIELICFKDGICFLSIKTYLDEASKFSDIINFNYKFKKSLSENGEKISIQSDNFKDSQDLIKILKSITENKILPEQFYTFSYTCVDGESWNNKVDFSNIKNDFIKIVSPEMSKIDIIDKSEYVKVGIGANSSAFITNSLESYNYTKLPFEAENEYIYTLIYVLYQKRKLQVIEKAKNIKIKNNIINRKKEKITEDVFGNALYDSWKKHENIEKLYSKVLDKYKKTKKRNLIIMWTILAICLIVNIVNIIILIGLNKGA